MPNGSVQIHEHITGVFAPTPPPAQPDMVPGVVAPANEADYLALYLGPLLEAAYDTFAVRYGYRPPTPIRIELYGRHADFSVRTVGLTGLGALGVSFGTLLALDSPQARDVGDLNYGSTAWQLISDAASQRWGSFGEIASVADHAAGGAPVDPGDRKSSRQNQASDLHPHAAPELPELCHRAADVFESVGVDPRRVCIGHLTGIRPDANRSRRLPRLLASEARSWGSTRWAT
jgi:hypothetical protein